MRHPTFQGDWLRKKKHWTIYQSTMVFRTLIYIVVWYVLVVVNEQHSILTCFDTSIYRTIYLLSYFSGAALNPKTPTWECRVPNLKCCMMTSSNGNIFRVTGPLCGEFIGHPWIPRTITWRQHDSSHIFRRLGIITKANVYEHRLWSNWMTSV